ATLEGIEMKKFLSMLFAASLMITMSCGKGKEAKEEEEGTDDQALQTASTASAGTAASAAQPAAAVPAEGATISGKVTLAGAVPAMPTIQMAADPYCQSQHASAPVKDEEVVVGPQGELANVFIYIKNVPGTYP